MQGVQKVWPQRSASGRRARGPAAAEAAAASSRLESSGADSPAGCGGGAGGVARVGRYRPRALANASASAGPAARRSRGGNPRARPRKEHGGRNLPRSTPSQTQRHGLPTLRSLTSAPPFLPAPPSPGTDVDAPAPAARSGGAARAAVPRAGGGLAPAVFKVLEARGAAGRGVLAAPRRRLVALARLEAVLAGLGVASIHVSGGAAGGWLLDCPPASKGS
jgi:hypothetical protein